MTDTAPTIVGSRARRIDVDDKLTGKARYATDLRLPGMLYGKIVRSDRPHARIVRIDTNDAEELPGVEVVLHGPFGRRFGPAIKDQTLFAVDHVRLVGEPSAAVAADSEATADLAASMIQVEYEDLPAVLDPVAPDANRPEKNPVAVALGRLGGKKGGPARAKKLSAAKRAAIAKTAAAVRSKSTPRN